MATQKTQLQSDRDSFGHRAVRDITVEQHLAERELLLELAHDLARSLEIGPIANTILTWAQKLLGVDYVDLMMMDAGGTELHGVANTVDSAAFRQERIDTSKELAIVSHVVRRRAPVIIENFRESTLVSERLRERYPLRAMWGVPLMSGEAIVGVLCAAYLKPEPITPDKVRLLQLLGDEAALAVERARLTESLQRRTAELLRSNAELEAVGSATAHALQEPLRGIRQYAEWLREDHADSLGTAGMEKLATIERLSLGLATRIETLLHYARLGRRELTRVVTDLNRLVGDGHEMLAALFIATRAELRVPRPLPCVRCAPVLVMEVLSNLFTNALKYNTNALKWIEVGYVAPDEGSLQAIAIENDAATVLYVRDNGIGIPAADRAAIFQLFRRLHGEGEFGGGTGAGLAISQKLIERHGGRLWVESTPGEGSTFYFTLRAE